MVIYRGWGGRKRGRLHQGGGNGKWKENTSMRA
jgi:hypothetical protein